MEEKKLFVNNCKYLALDIILHIFYLNLYIFLYFTLH